VKTPSRWGCEDEAGAFNLVDKAATLRGLASVREGRVISLGLPIKNGDRGPGVESRQAPSHYMTRDGGDYCAGLAEREGFGFSDDVILTPTQSGTHIDALAHVWANATMYNGFPASAVTSRGASRCGIDKLGPVITRGLIVDLSAHSGPNFDLAIGLETLQAALVATSIVPAPGDALLLRTGWLKARKERNLSPLHTAGLHHECSSFIVEQGFFLVAADNTAVEVLPSHDPNCAVPMHIQLIRDNGIYLGELFDLDELATSGARQCMLALAPLRIVGGAGSPLNPIAVI
jgi:kynurenine formamidase